MCGVCNILWMKRVMRTIVGSVKLRAQFVQMLSCNVQDIFQFVPLEESTGADVLMNKNCLLCLLQNLSITPVEIDKVSLNWKNKLLTLWSPCISSKNQNLWIDH